MTNTTTHHPEGVHIDEQGRQASSSVQWFLEKRHLEGSHPITANNWLQMLICGQEGFKSIAGDLEQAESTVDLVCWGFDPGMELIRSGSEWPRGETFGGLLQRLATRKTNPVKVRLLIWYTYVGGQAMKNMPGHTDGMLYNSTSAEDENRMAAMGGGFGYRPTPDDKRPPLTRRADHCVRWWRWALDQKNASQIEVRMRACDTQAIRKALATETTKPSSSGKPYLNEKSLLEDSGAHHQKTILIDYHHRGGAKAVGYVMGLNSLTGYWDTQAHAFNDPLREYDEPKETQTYALVKHSPETARRVRRDPYRDYACRIEGQALACVDRNFTRSWVRAGGTRGTGGAAPPPMLAKKNFFGQASRVQVVRTQPEESDRTIRETYWHAPTFARHYLYMENQYFQYADWAARLKETRREYRAGFQRAGAGPEQAGILHAFIVIPKPERAQMVPRTFDTLKALGRSDQMHERGESGKDEGQYLEMQKEQEALAKWERDMAAWRQRNRTRPAYGYPEPPPPQPRSSEVGRDARKIQGPSAKELEAMGLKVLVGMLVSHDDGGSGLGLKTPRAKYRQVYIHSKLMVIDDAFFTIGSANMNQRSMVADSEINIATDDHAKARDLRSRVWELNTGGYEGCNPGSNSQADVREAFRQWQKLMEENDSAMKNGQSLVGHLCTLRDSKVSYERYA